MTWLYISESMELLRKEAFRVFRVYKRFLSGSIAVPTFDEINEISGGKSEQITHARVSYLTSSHNRGRHPAHP